jgi:hypothetical protein
LASTSSYRFNQLTVQAKPVKLQSMIIYPETRTPGSRLVDLRVDGFINVKDPTASLTPEMIMIIVSGIEAAIAAA